MSERICLACGMKKLALPHFRVWEENIGISHMLCFCSIECMINYYQQILTDTGEDPEN